MKKIGKGKGYGKTILFGEHFVVYKLPAIASAIHSSTTAEVKPWAGKGSKLNDLRNATEGYKKKKEGQQKDSLEYIFKKMNIDVSKTPLEITLAGNLVAMSGIGASAANCVAIARAINELFDMNLSEEEINEVAYEGEKGYHGTPSGIDNTVSTYGTLLWYKKGEQITMDKINTKEKVEIVIADTGIPADTIAVVADVKKNKEENPEKFEKIFKEYEVLVKKAKNSLMNGDWKEAGKLMNENHELLRRITVCSDKSDELVDIARKNGAFGAKTSGTGRGGVIVALTPGKDVQEKVAIALKKKSSLVVTTTIGG